MGSEVVSVTPGLFDRFIRSEARKMGALIKGLKLQLDGPLCFARQGQVACNVLRRARRLWFLRRH